MAQSISLMGATYNNVPSVRLPKSTSGFAEFTDVTDTTATAGDVATGKYFYTSSGVKTQGTNSGGGGSSKNFQFSNGTSKITNKTAYTTTNATLKITKSGTYKVTWFHYSYAASTSYYLTRLYKNDTAVGSTHGSPSYSSGAQAVSETLTLNANDTITVYARTRSGNSYWTCVAGLIAEEQ